MLPKKLSKKSNRKSDFRGDASAESETTRWVGLVHRSLRGGIGLDAPCGLCAVCCGGGLSVVAGWFGLR